MVHDDAIPAGTLLGRFRIEELAGRGGMGDVYQAWDTALERRVALKRLRLDVADPVALARFRREAQSLAQLNHPSVCQVYDYAETDRGLFIAMEWVEGDTLPQLMGWPRKPLPPKRVVHILRGIAEALAAAHGKEIVHRDLKPSNVMVTLDGQVKVLDFGLAKGSAAEEDQAPPPPPIPENPAQRFLAAARGEVVDPPTLSSGAREPLTQAGLFMGTPGYASPEQARGRWVTAASDVFGMGILGHELLTGLRPFPGEGEDQLRAVVKNQRVVAHPPMGTRRLWALVERMLLPKPKDRPTAAEVAAALAELESPKGIPWWSAVAAGVVVAALGGLLWLRSRGVIADLVKERPARVAVLRIHNATGDPTLDAVVQTGLPELLARSLQDSPRLSVIGSDSLRSVASKLSVDLQQAGDQDLGRIGSTLGAALLLKGDLVRDGARHEDRLHLVLTDRDGRVRYEGTVTQPVRSEFLPQALLYPAADRLLKAVDPWAAQAGKPRLQVPDQVFSAYSEGMTFIIKGEFGKAEPLLSKAAYAAPDFSLGVGAYAVCLRFMGRPEAGPASFWAVYSARQNGDRYGEVFGLSALASWALDQRDLDRADSAYTQALALAEANRDLDRQSTALNGLGRVAQARNDLKGAEARYQQALTFAQQTGNRVQQAQVMANLANLALGAGDLAGAEQRYREGLAMAQAIGSRESEALELNNIGVVLLTQLRPDEALAPLSRALELRRAIHAAQGELSSLRNLGIAHLMKGDTREATQGFQASLELARTLKNRYAEGKALFYLGEVDLQQGHFDSALASFRECAPLLQQAGAPVPLAQAQAGMVVCLVRMGRGNSAEAPQLLLEAMRTAPQDPFVLRARAWVAQATGRREEALELFKEAQLDKAHGGPEIQGDLQRTLRDLLKP